MLKEKGGGQYIKHTEIQHWLHITCHLHCLVLIFSAWRLVHVHTAPALGSWSQIQGRGQQRPTQPPLQPRVQVPGHVLPLCSYSVCAVWTISSNRPPAPRDSLPVLSSSPTGQWFTYLSDTCPPTYVPTEGSGTGEPTSPPWGPVSTPARQFNKM